jgi:hypothetical protein
VLECRVCIDLQGGHYRLLTPAARECQDRSLTHEQVNS